MNGFGDWLRRRTTSRAEDEIPVARVWTRYIGRTPVPGTVAVRYSVKQGAISTVRLFVVLAAWVLFFHWWSVVLQQEGLAALALVVGKIMGGLVAIAVFAGWWIRHNLRIARRGKRGRVNRYIPANYRRDVLGHSLRLPPGDRLLHAPYVRVELNAGTKHYLVSTMERQ